MKINNINNKVSFFYIYVLILVFIGISCSFTANASAPTSGIFSSIGDNQRLHDNLFPEVGVGSMVVVADIDNDGLDEYIIGTSKFENSNHVSFVTVIDNYNSETHEHETIKNFYPFNEFGVNIAVGNVMGDKDKEIIVAARHGGDSLIRIYSSAGELLATPFYAYAPLFKGGVNLATGDIDGDGMDEIITGAGYNGGPHVRYFNADGTLVCQFFAYDLDFRGGVIVGALDYNDDGIDEVITVPQVRHTADIRVFRASDGKMLQEIKEALGLFTGGVSMSVNTSGDGKRVLLGAGRGGGPHVIQYNLVTGKKDSVSIFPFQTSWRGGVNVSFIDYSSENGVTFFAVPGATYTEAEDVVVDSELKLKGQKIATGMGGPPKSAVYSRDGEILYSFPSMKAGSSVATGDIDGDGIDEIIFGSPQGESPSVYYYEYDGTLIRIIYPYTTSLHSGINVSVGDVMGNKKEEIVISPRRGGGPHILIYDDLGNKLNGKGFFSFDPNFHGGVSLAIGDINGDGINEIITGAGPGGGPHVRIFHADGRLVNQFMVETVDIYPNIYRAGIQVYIMPDHNSDGVDDILIVPNRESGHIYVWSGITGKEIRWYPNGFDSYIPSLADTNLPPISSYASFVPHTIGGKVRLARSAGSNIGPIVFDSGRDDWAGFAPYSADWKGGATIAVLDINNDGKAEYVVVPGSIIESLELNNAYDFTRPSVLTDGVPYNYSYKVVNTDYGSVGVNMLIVNLCHPNVKVMSLNGKCDNNDCHESLASFVGRTPGGVAGLNGTGDSGGTFGSWYDSIHGNFQGGGSGIMFDSNNSWYRYMNSTLSYNPDIARAQFKYKTGYSLQSRIGTWEPIPTSIASRSDGHWGGISGFGFKGSDMYLFVISHSNASAQGQALRYFNFIGGSQTDGGGSSAMYYDNHYVAGPGRELNNAIVIAER